MYFLTSWVAISRGMNIKTGVATVIHILATVATLIFQFHHYKFSHGSNGARNDLGQAPLLIQIKHGASLVKLGLISQSEGR